MFRGAGDSGDFYAPLAAVTRVDHTAPDDLASLPSTEQVACAFKAFDLRKPATACKTLSRARKLLQDSGSSCSSRTRNGGIRRDTATTPPRATTTGGSTSGDSWTPTEGLRARMANQLRCALISEGVCPTNNTPILSHTHVCTQAIRTVQAARMQHPRLGGSVQVAPSRPSSTTRCLREGGGG